MSILKNQETDLKKSKAVIKILLNTKNILLRIIMPKDIKKIVEHMLFKGMNNSKLLGMEYSFNVKELKIENNSVLVKLTPRFLNKVWLLGEMTAAMAFITGTLGDDNFGLDIYNVGIQAEKDGKTLIRIISSVKEGKKAGSGEVISWLRNSHVEDFTDKIKKTIFLVEGETELTAFPVIMKELYIDPKGYIIDIVPFSKENIKSMLVMSKHYDMARFVLFDNDKKDVVKDLTKSNLLDEGEYHIFKKGEFEDYIPSNILADSLNDLSPGLNITEKHISEERTKNKRTVKIINDFYRKKEMLLFFLENLL